MSTFIDIFESLIFDYKQGKFGTIDEHSFISNNQKSVEKYLIICILSSNWTYERAVDAANVFIDKFGSYIDNSQLPHVSNIELYLRSPAVRHRFPKSKSEQIQSSLQSLFKLGIPFLDFVNQFSSEQEVRDFVSSNFAGMGYKQSSMFLRDIGFAQNLAVIDMHIIWYLMNAENIEVGTLSRKKYLSLENYLHSMCERIGISMIALDRLIWVTVREFKKLKRMNGCATQYALPLEA